MDGVHVLFFALIFILGGTVICGFWGVLPLLHLICAKFLSCCFKGMWRRLGGHR
jgi:hypothetical protein